MSQIVLVKVCGLCREEDVDLAVELGAHWVGFNFAPESPRYLPKQRALRLRNRLDDKTRCVAVSMHYDADWVKWALEELGADLIQVHGEESARAVSEIGCRAVRVFLGPPGPQGLTNLGTPGLVLVDRPPQPGQIPGGTGSSWSYDGLTQLAFSVPWLVAGGIRPNSVREVLAKTGASGIDVASGVEREPGVKDARLLRQLMEEVESYARGRSV